MVDLRPTNRKLRARALRMIGELTGLAPERARALARRAGGRPNVALVMHRLGVDAKEARVASRGSRRQSPCGARGVTA